MTDRVGAFVQRATAGPLAVANDTGANLCIAVTADRGPANVPTLITSMARYEAVFGKSTLFSDGRRYSPGYEVLSAFFGSGGRVAWVTRIVGATAVENTVTLEDRAGAPLNTLQVDLVGPGTWADGYDIVIADGTRTNTFKLSLLDTNDVVVESWDNLKMDGESMERVNSGSDYMRLTDLGSATNAPDNRPAAATTTVASGTHGGVDDNNPDAAAIVGTDTSGVKTGLKAFRSDLYGRGFLAAPDLDTATTVIAEMIDQSEKHYRMIFTSSQSGASVATAITQRANWDAFDVGFYYPRLRKVDAYDKSLKTYPPIGHVMGRYVEVLEQQGPGKAPAGRDFTMGVNTIGLETLANGQPLIDEGVAEVLLANQINPIWDRDGSGARVWGAQTASEDPNWQYLHHAYLHKLVASRQKQLLDSVVYDIADDLFFSQVEQGLFAIMADIHAQRGFRGEIPQQGTTADPSTNAFDVRCNEGLLSAADKNNGIVRAETWFRPAGTAETIIAVVSKRGE